MEASGPTGHSARLLGDRGTRPVVWRCVLVPVRPVHEAGIVWRRANDSVVYVLVYTSTGVVPACMFILFYVIILCFT